MFNQNLVFQGLATIVTGIPEAGYYTVDVKSTIPTLTNGGGISALVIVIKKNSSTLYTGTAGAEGAWVQFACAAGDTISVITSSANAVDAKLNVIKSTVAISSGGY